MRRPGAPGPARAPCTRPSRSHRRSSSASRHRPRARRRSRSAARVPPVRSPRSGISMLDGLTSRWITPCAWAWASASHSAMPIWMTSRSDSSPSARSRSSVAPCTSSETRYAPSSSTAASYKVTIPGCASRAAARASRSKRPPTTRSRGRILIATSRSRRSSRASHTVANPPVPSRRRSRYRSRTTGASDRPPGSLGPVASSSPPGNRPIRVLEPAIRRDRPRARASFRDDGRLPLCLQTFGNALPPSRKSY